MNEFSTYQGALEIFRNVGAMGATENCIFGGLVDYSKSSEFTASMIGNAFGPVGYVAGNLIGRERDERAGRLTNYMFVLFDFTEAGVGIMPLRGSGLRLNPAKQEPDYNAFVYYWYQELADISVKNYMRLRKDVKTITITLTDGNKLHFTANMAEKPMPYQETFMNAFVQRYQK